MNDSELNNLFEILKRILDKRHLITIYQVEENGNENNSKNDIDTAILEAIFKASAYKLSNNILFLHYLFNCCDSNFWVGGRKPKGLQT